MLCSDGSWVRTTLSLGFLIAVIAASGINRLLAIAAQVHFSKLDHKSKHVQESHRQALHCHSTCAETVHENSIGGLQACREGGFVSTLLTAGVIHA